MYRCVVFIAHFTTFEQTSSRCSTQEGQKVHSGTLYGPQTTRAHTVRTVWALHYTRSSLDLSSSHFPYGGGGVAGWWLEQERVLALSSQGIVGRRAQERRWSITGGGGCYVALPGNRKAQEVGSCWLAGWGWCWWCWCVCGGGSFSADHHLHPRRIPAKGFMSCVKHLLLPAFFLLLYDFCIFAMFWYLSFVFCSFSQWINKPIIFRPLFYILVQKHWLVVLSLTRQICQWPSCLIKGCFPQLPFTLYLPFTCQTIVAVTISEPSGYIWMLCIVSRKLILSRDTREEAFLTLRVKG